jgi:hypothetical protein
MKLEKKHWMIIGVVAILVIVWYFFLRKKKAESGFTRSKTLEPFQEYGYTKQGDAIGRIFIPTSSNGKVRIFRQMPSYPNNKIQMYTKGGSCQNSGDWMMPVGPQYTICPSVFSLNDKFTGYYKDGGVYIIKINKANGEVINFTKNQDGAVDYPYTSSSSLKEVSKLYNNTL